MNRNFESMIADLIYNEIQGGINCLIGNVREILNNSSIFNQNGYEDIKQKIKSEVSYLYDDIAQKMDDNRSSMTDLNSQPGHQIIRTHGVQMHGFHVLNEFFMLPMCFRVSNALLGFLRVICVI